MRFSIAKNKTKKFVWQKYNNKISIKFSTPENFFDIFYTKNYQNVI